MGEAVPENRESRLARLAGIHAHIVSREKLGVYSGKLSNVVDNTLDRLFAVDAPDRVWATGITYLCMHEVVAHLFVVIDLFSRRFVGWVVQSRQTSERAVQALLMTTWRSKPGPGLLIHSDQGSQFTSRERAAFLLRTNLEHLKSYWGNCHDNAVAESFFQLLKLEEIRRHKYLTHEQPRRDVFEYIELLFNSKRKHTKNGMLSPVDYENEQRDLK